MSPILPFVLAGAAYLDPAHDHAVMADVIARVVETDEPLFRDDEDRRKTASLVLAVAWREGSLGLSVRGDCTKSKPGAPCVGTPRAWCTLQVSTSMGGGPELNADPDLCIRTGLAILRRSVSECPHAPVAWYAVGRAACTDARALRLSRDRVVLAARVRAAAIEALSNESST